MLLSCSSIGLSLPSVADQRSPSSPQAGGGSPEGVTAMSDVTVPRRLLELVSQSEFWVTALRNEAERLERLGRLFGVPVIAVTTVTGAAIFTQLNSNPASWAKVLFGLVNLLAAVLAAVQT